MIRDDITAAATRGDRAHAAALRLVLRNFVLGHPRCDERIRSELRGVERRGA
jgi:hypothetical protein